MPKLRPDVTAASFELKKWVRFVIQNTRCELGGDGARTACDKEVQACRDPKTLRP